MVVKTLLAFLCAPNLNSVFYKPFYDKRRFILLAAQTVKHEYKKNIKFTYCSVLLDFLNRVAVFCGDFETRDAFFTEFFDNFPVVLVSDKLVAPLLLHGNIILFNLLFRGDTI